MENLPQIIDACNRLIVTWGDQVVRQEIMTNITGLVATIFIVLPTFGLGIWRLGINRKWWQ